MKSWSSDRPSHPNATLVMAVYNKPREFQMCLEGYRRQSYRGPWQLLLADDGSKPEIESIFEAYSKQVPFLCTYLRQEDRGWGKLRMLNAAVLESKADWMIFTDGDCVPHQHFLRAHTGHAEEKTVLCGRRVDLMEEISKPLTPEDVSNGKLDSLSWFFPNYLKDKMDFGQQGIYIPRFLADFFNPYWRKTAPSLLGSNMSLHKKWLMEVNGFDEAFDRPGFGEDTDLERRLKMLGLKFKWITHQAIQYHVWHDLTTVNRSIETFEKLKQSNNRRATIGIDELKKSLLR